MLRFQSKIHRQQRKLLLKLLQKTRSKRRNEKAAQYDYDGAMELLKKDASYSSNSDMQNAVSKYEEAKASCKSYCWKK